MFREDYDDMIWMISKWLKRKPAPDHPVYKFVRQLPDKECALYINLCGTIAESWGTPLGPLAKRMRKRWAEGLRALVDKLAGKDLRVGGMAGVDEGIRSAIYCARTPRRKSRPAWWSLILVARVPLLWSREYANCRPPPTRCQGMGEIAEDQEQEEEEEENDEDEGREENQDTAKRKRKKKN